MKPAVVAVSKSGSHTFSKPNLDVIRLIEDFGVQGDAHAGTTVKHRYLVKKDPIRPNIRQVHLIHQELFDELGKKGFTIHPGELGENITTRGIDLLRLSSGTILKIGREALVKITALRNPCKQIDDFQPGLLKAVLYKDRDGKPVRETGVMGVVVKGGDVRPGDIITVELDPEPHQKLEYIW